MSARVLVVDDLLPNVKLLEGKLNSEYYDVVTARSGIEALQVVKDSPPDIILLDVGSFFFVFFYYDQGTQVSDDFLKI